MYLVQTDARRHIVCVVCARAVRFPEKLSSISISNWLLSLEKELECLWDLESFSLNVKNRGQGRYQSIATSLGLKLKGTLVKFSEETTLFLTLKGTSPLVLWELVSSYPEFFLRVVEEGAWKEFECARDLGLPEIRETDLMNQVGKANGKTYLFQFRPFHIKQRDPFVLQREDLLNYLNVKSHLLEIESNDVLGQNAVEIDKQRIFFELRREWLLIKLLRDHALIEPVRLKGYLDE